jgi:hypothetical protein
MTLAICKICAGKIATEPASHRRANPTATPAHRYDVHLVSTKDSEEHRGPHRTRSKIKLGVVALVGALALGGCTSTARPETSATAPADASSASTHDNTNIIVYSIDSDGPNFSAVVSGTVGDYGPAVTVLPSGKIDPGHTSELELRLTHGSFRLSIADLDKKLVAATRREPIYSRTCSTFVKVTATAPIVPRSGTGSYRKISGSFILNTTLDEVHVKPCQKTRLGIARQVLELAGSGNVSVG